MTKILHAIYKAIGFLFCELCLIYWNLRDRIKAPTENSILFVAHPDDDTLFFHTFIKERKPYIVLLTTGWSLRRLPCFFKVMKRYGVRYRAYPMRAREKREQLIEKRVRQMLASGKYEICATHNSDGEYGHETHKRIHNAVLKVSTIPVFVPVSSTEIIKYPLSKNEIEEKSYIFNSIYTTEKWVMDEYSTWFLNEKLVLHHQPYKEVL